MKSWLSDRLVIFRSLYIFLLPLILAIIAWGWWWTLWYVCIILVVALICSGSDMNSDQDAGFMAISTGVVAFFAVHAICFANPQVFGASILGGFLYSIIWSVVEIAIYPLN